MKVCSLLCSEMFQHNKYTVMLPEKEEDGQLFRRVKMEVLRLEMDLENFGLAEINTLPYQSRN